MRIFGFGINACGRLAIAISVFAGIGCSGVGADTSDGVVEQTVMDLARRNAIVDEDEALSHVMQSSSRHLVSRVPPVLLVDISREPRSFGNLFRFSFISDPTIVPTTLNRTNANRAFMTASYFFMPPLSVGDAVQYVGLADEPEHNFAAYRCKPRSEAQLDALDPVLATWPNVFEIIRQDFGSTYSCPGGQAPDGATVDNQLLCLANEFVDTPTSEVTVGLDRMFDVAAQIFADPALTAEVSRLYGIAPAFSGLGYAVKGSANAAELTTDEAIRNLIAPEYLVRNVSFPEANCRCILVPPYPGRAEDPIDPDFVWRAGGSETCRIVHRLRSTSGHRPRWWRSYEEGKHFSWD